MGETVPLILGMMSPMMNGFETYESDINMSETSSIYGIQPTLLAVFAKHFIDVAAK
ncbi:MAG: hypothetical protein GY943_22715 [Chloroflexi bacterium]|nr:hypothetical protein [Chloroflexota bacterium]